MLRSAVIILELKICNQIDRFSIAIDVIARISSLKVASTHVKEMLKDEQIPSQNYTFEHSIDRSDVVNWQWIY